MNLSGGLAGSMRLERHTMVQRTDRVGDLHVGGELFVGGESVIPRAAATGTTPDNSAPINHIHTDLQAPYILKTSVNIPIVQDGTLQQVGSGALDLSDNTNAERAISLLTDKWQLWNGTDWSYVNNVRDIHQLADDPLLGMTADEFIRKSLNLNVLQP